MSLQHVMKIGGREYRADVKELNADRAVVVVEGQEYVVDLVQVGRRQSGLPEAPRVAAPSVAPATAPASSTPSAPQAQASRHTSGGGEGSITAPMPGLILQVRVKEGEQVQAGQTLMVMEAMKMENAITAPCNGAVTKLYVREGDSIGEGDLLVHVSRPSMTTL